MGSEHSSQAARTALGTVCWWQLCLGSSPQELGCPPLLCVFVESCMWKEQAFSNSESWLCKPGRYSAGVEFQAAKLSHVLTHKYAYKDA